MSADKPEQAAETRVLAAESDDQATALVGTPPVPFSASQSNQEIGGLRKSLEHPEGARKSVDFSGRRSIEGPGLHRDVLGSGDIAKRMAGLNTRVSFASTSDLTKVPSSGNFEKKREALKHVHSRVDLLKEFHLREIAAAALKREKAADWLPEYRPVSIVPPSKGTLTHLDRVTRVSPALILQDVPVSRKTKIVCTLGPSCWSEEGLAKLLDAGMDVARFNFSHGTHEAHQEVLDRLRKVAKAKNSNVAFLLDTKGPEVRTAMLRGGKDIELVKGQDVIVVGVGEEYTSWEGYKDEATGETKIGLSYAKLCQSIKPGGTILIADGAISIEVVKILNEKELLGRVVNSYKLGQRKNCNLPGVHVDLPVLSPKDIDDVQNFAVKNDMDFIAASFVQSESDVKDIRKVLDEAGGYHIKIISKIENEAGLINMDGILAEGDGVMVARGDLAMEVPAEKIALAQKMIIAKANVMGKVVITATQMLESMTGAPLPTRAEMTDVANAVFDGTDAVMLSGETANGAYPDTAVRMMAHIVEYAELGVDHNFHYDWVNKHSSMLAPVSPLEATLAGVAKSAITFSMDTNGDGVLDASEGCIGVVFTRSGRAAQIIAKYRPPCPIITISDHDWVLRQASIVFGLYPTRVGPVANDGIQAAVEAALEQGKNKALATEGKNILVASGSGEPWADNVAEVSVNQLLKDGPSRLSRAVSCRRTLLPTNPIEYRSPFLGNSIPCTQSLHITPQLICDRVFNFRSAKIIASLGPASWSDSKINSILDKGVSILRIFMGQATKNIYANLVDHLRSVIDERLHSPLGAVYTQMPALMATIQGPEVHTTLLRGHTPLQLKKGQTVILVPTNDPAYEGFVDKDTGEAYVGINYPTLTHKVKRGDVILLSEGTVSVKVTDIVTRLAASTSKANLGDPSASAPAPHTFPYGRIVAKCANDGKLGEIKAVDIAGHSLLQEQFLTDFDRESLKFCCEHNIDFVSLPNVSSSADVIAVRQLLDSHGGARIKIISHIDTAQAIHCYDDILEVSDAVLISRAYLGMRIPAAKVPLAQKWMIAKANLKGRPVILSGQLMASMVESPRPTRAEMTDVANALYDGVDAVMLREETANGQFVERVVEIAADILKDAQDGIDEYSQMNVIRNFTPRPMATLECLCSSAVKAAIDMDAALIVVITNTGAPIRGLAKYRPAQAIIVVTTKAHVARQCNLNYGCIPLWLRGAEGMYQQNILDRIVEFARSQKLAALKEGDAHGDQLIVVQGPSNRIFATEEDLAEMHFVTHVVGNEAAEVVPKVGYVGADTIAYRSTKVGLDLVLGPSDVRARKTKVICTLGPKCWTQEGLEMLVDTGMNIARFNFSHGAHSDHQAVLDRLRDVLEDKGAAHVALLLDTKGPEIRTAMLRGGQDIALEAGQIITVVAVGEEYTSWEGYKDETTGETKIGLSYAKLCRDVKPGGMIKIGDGQITLEVVEILSDRELTARVLNTKKLGQRKNCNLPGVHVDLPVLGANDINDVQNFAVKNGMDFVAASFVQSADDVRFIRKVLDEVGGYSVKIISKIESTSGLLNYDAILAESDGIMVARGDLAMEIPSEKVALAQKMMITKANIAGKFVITATQMLESMTGAPLPTRAEMTDVANAVWDGTDAVMLSGETANGAFPDLALSTMAAIVANAEVGTNYPQVYDFIRDFSPRPMSTYEAVLGCAAKNVLDIDAGLILVFSHTGRAAHMVSKYRPRVPVLLITDSVAAARSCAPVFGIYVYILPEGAITVSRWDVEFEVLVEEAILVAMEAGLCLPDKEVVLVHGCEKADAESGTPMVSTQVAPPAGETVDPLPLLAQQAANSGIARVSYWGEGGGPPALSDVELARAQLAEASVSTLASLPSAPSAVSAVAAQAQALQSRLSSAAATPTPSITQPADEYKPPGPTTWRPPGEPPAGSGAAAVAKHALGPSPEKEFAPTMGSAPNSAVKRTGSLAVGKLSLTISPTTSQALSFDPATPFPKSYVAKTLSLRTTAISLSDIMDHSLPWGRKTKIVCTLGPASWSEEGLAKLIDAGMDVARFNFSHGTHESHQEVLDRLRKVEAANSAQRRIAYLLDTKGPEIRTAMLRGGKDIALEEEQLVTVVAVGDAYDKWEGYKDETTGETKIGLSYAKLCQSVKVGGRILLADGSVVLEVQSITSPTELVAKCMNAKTLGQRKNCNLPGVHVDIPVLTAKDTEDLQQFCCKNKMDFVAASFVQSANDVRHIRKVLDDAGGHNVKIISKIENEAGLIHFDGILAETDGIMVARGDLGMEIPSEKVALAQKMMITKANIAGKFVITATQMLESMTGTPLPTRAEMTDVANAVFDGTDAVMLSGETANGKFPDLAVRTMAAIVVNAETGNAYMSTQAFLRDHTPKPFGITEATGVSCVGASVMCNAQLIITISSGGYTSRMVSKYRPAVPQIVVTDSVSVANQACIQFGQYALLVDSLSKGASSASAVDELVSQAAAFGLQHELWHGLGTAIVLHGQTVLSADSQPVLRAVDLAEHIGQAPAELPIQQSTGGLSHSSSRKASLTRCFSRVA